MIEKLSKKQRVMRAKSEYTKGMRKIWEQLKSKYHLTDDVLDDLISNSNELDIDKIWEEKLDVLRRNVENKYDVYIEHEDTTIRCFAW